MTPTYLPILIYAAGLVASALTGSWIPETIGVIVAMAMVIPAAVATIKRWLKERRAEKQ